MAKSSLEEAQFVIKPYYGWLIDKINLIYYTWNEGSDVVALTQTYKLCAFLVPELREQLKEQIEAIEKGYAECLNRKGVGYYGTSRLQNRCLRAVAEEHLRPFIISMIKALDERDYLEKPLFKRLSSKDLEEMENATQVAEG